MFFGYLAFVLHWIDDGFIISANRLVFYTAMPALVFLSVSSADFSGQLPWREVLAFSGAIIITTLLGYLVSGALKLDPPRKGPFLQGMVRGNFAIIGLAVVDQVLGSDWLPVGAVLLAFFLLIHNIASVLILTSCSVDTTAASHPGRKLGLVILRTFQNPLTIAIILGILFSLNSISLPRVFNEAFNYLRYLALPLALGGHRRFRRPVQLRRSVSSGNCKHPVQAYSNACSCPVFRYSYGCKERTSAYIKYFFRRSRRSGELFHVRCNGRRPAYCGQHNSCKYSCLFSYTIPFSYGS